MRLNNMPAWVSAVKGPWAWGGLLLLGTVAFLLWPSEDSANQGARETTPASQAQDAPSAVFTCAMHPHVRQHGAGTCPLCGMALVPVANPMQAGSPGEPRLQVTQAQRELMNIRTGPVVRRFPDAEIRLFGEVDYDETRIARITAWVPGRIEALYGNYSGLRVRQGDHLVRLYSPELFAAQAELIEAGRVLSALSERGSRSLLDSAQAMLDAARDKLRRLGMEREQIRAVEASGEAEEYVTINAPIGGVVIERHVAEGAYLGTGEPILTLADLDKVWVRLDAYETDLGWLRYGQLVELTSEALPGRLLEGQIAFIDPTVDPGTRTAKVRVNLDNAEGLLKPGMFMQAKLKVGLAATGRVLDARLAGKWISPMHPEIVKDGPGACDVCGMALVPAETLGYAVAEQAATEAPLMIPASAVMLTGARAIVYIEDKDAAEPTYLGREVTLGARAGDYYLVEGGLREGERVVVSGNFKIDSALEIQALPSMMSRHGRQGAAGHDHMGHTP